MCDLFTAPVTSVSVQQMTSEWQLRITQGLHLRGVQLPQCKGDNCDHSGLMIAHVTAAALTSENKYLGHPASIDSIPTSTDKEDHVSMGVTSARKLLDVIENTKNVLAIELLCSCQAIDFHRPMKTSPALENLHTRIRKHVPTIKEDRVFHKDIKNILRVIESHELVALIEDSLGELE